MGQAKQRGTLEQRKAESIAKRQAEAAEFNKAREAREAAMTPEEKSMRASRAGRAVRMAAIMSLLGGASPMFRRR